MIKINIFAAVLLIVFSLNLHPLIDMNDIVPVFPGEKQVQIEGAVIEGAIHFLEAQSFASLLLEEIEKSAQQPLDYPSALAYAEKAVIEVEKSIHEYDRAISAGKQVGYVNEVIQKFKNFDYDAFASDKGLNRDIMTVVKAYFTGGNILGAYQQRLEHLGDILVTLHQIKEKLTDRQSPDISLAWKLFQRFSEASLFGNYCTVTANAVFER
ncbi:MAG: hypothetical protein JSV88_32705 [Candidatus Aminicenantes bacterium]|nr:MAG: hypothetical protein JSV88_32705 [Candidatus Aminicenantes bacterium]